MKMLKPRLATLNTSIVKTLDHRIGATPRQRGRKWMTKREQWFSQHPLCVECEKQGRVTAGRILDHIIPLWEGGADDESNYQTMCPACHDSKTSAEAGRRPR